MTRPKHDPQSGETIKVIRVAPSSFVLGDKVEWRPIYGPENEHGGRAVVGWVVAGDPAQKLTSMLEYADANMPPEEP